LSKQEAPNATPISYLAPALPSSPNGTVPLVTSEEIANVCTITIPQSANYDDTVNPVKIGFLPRGFFCKVRNLQALPIKIVGPRVGDPGAIISPATTGFVSSDEAGGLFLVSGGGGGGGATECTVYSPAGGGLDDGAAITALLQIGNVCLVPLATYTFLTPIIVTSLSNRKLTLDDATMLGAMAQTGGGTNSIVYGTHVFLGVGNTTLATGSEIGNNLINVVSAAGFGVNAVLEIQMGGGFGPFTFFRVQSKAVNAVTLSAPLPFSGFAPGDPVRTVASRPSLLTISCKNTTFTGSGDAAISITGGDKILIEGPAVIDCSQAVGGVTLARGLELISCTESSLKRVYANGYFSGTNADQFDYGFRLSTLVRCYVDTIRAAECTAANIQTFDCAQTVFNNLYVHDSATSLASGVLVGGLSIGNLAGCVDCDFYSIHAENFFNGWGMNIDPATRCCVFGYHGEYAALLQFGFTKAEDLFFYGVTVHHGPDLAATGFGQGFIVGPASTGCEMDSVSCVDCGSTVGTTPDVAEIQSGNIVLRNYKQRNPTVATTRGLVIAFTTTPGIVVRLQDVDIETCPTGAGMTGGAIRFTGNAAGEQAKLFLERATFTTNRANDVCVAHTTAGVMQLTDVASRNPLAVATTSGYVGAAGTLLRREGRINFASCATPITAAQSNEGTFATTGAVAVNVGFFDIVAQTLVDVWMTAAAGTPAPDQTIVVTAGTGFAFTGKAADTSTRAYAIHGG